MYSRYRKSRPSRKYALAPAKKYRRTSYYGKRRPYTPAYARLPYFPPYLMDVPAVKYAKLRYVVNDNVNGPGVNSIVVREYRINGLFDPEVALGGHQPMGFDELMKQYEKYTVLKAHIELENMSVVSYKAMFLCLVREQGLGDLAAMYASDGLSALLERPGVSESLCVTTGEYQASKRKVSMWCDMSKFTGKSYKDLIGDYGYQGDVGHDPDQQQYVAVLLYNPQGSDQSSNSAQFKVTITYYAAFSKRMPPEGS